MNRLPILATIALLIADATDRRLLSAFLAQTGYVVQVVSVTGSLEEYRCASLLIIDEPAARRHGAALLKIKQNCLPVYLPILLTLAGPTSATPWLRAGFDDVLRLPLNKNDLLARLEAFLRLRQHSQDILSESTQRYRSTFDLAPVGIVHMALDGSVTLVNPYLCALLKRPAKDIVGHQMTELIDPLDQHRMHDAIRASVEGITNVQSSFDQRYLRDGLSPVWTAVRVALVRDAAGTARHLIAIIEDNSARQQMEQALRESERFIKSTIDALSEHICVIDEGGTILAVNQAWREFGLANGGLISIAWGHSNYLQVCDDAAAAGNDDAGVFVQGMREVLLGQRKEFTLEYSCHSPDAQRWFIARVTRFALDGPIRVVVSHENITTTKMAQAHLSYLAHYDALTDLPNRLLFYDRLKQALLQAERSHWTVAVMFIDLDHFKTVNDTLGHAAGDRLLQQASCRIVACLRGNDTVARLGGDEFGLFLPDLGAAPAAALVAEKIMASLAEPFDLEGSEVFITSSIGITLFPIDGSDADLLVCSADTAMYRAKQQGRNNYQYFTARMNAQMLERVRLENGLRKALEP